MLLEREKILKNILIQWCLINPKIEKQYHEESSRIILKISDGDNQMLLKGIPDTVLEEVIISNVSAHKFLKEKGNIAPDILVTSTGFEYIHIEGYWFYLMEFIEGNNLEEIAEDEFELGRLVRTLHSFTDYSRISSLNPNKERFYDWFKDKEFKKEFDEILDTLPDFNEYDCCFIHSDIGPHNAMRRNTGEVVFIDLDDAGIGSRYLDLGWAFIMQFVDFNHSTKEMHYRFDLAKAFLAGYYGNDSILENEYDLLWYGAIFMHISYMQCFGPYAVDSLWNILKFGMEQKEKLWNYINSREVTN